MKVNHANLGLDVGGAHLKAALVEAGRVLDVRQIACPLWQGMDKLDTALAEIAPLAARADRVAVTMTGELSDLFANRREGVERLVARLVEAFGPATRFWMGLRGFGSAEDAIARPEAVASANFLATAAFVATKTENALVVDMGSTTTDIIAIAHGQPAPLGLTDAERLASGELVYTGLTRTALMGVAMEAPFQGRWQGLCREVFATMADARRILGELPEGADQHETADRKGKTVEGSVARLGRMFGRDAADGSARDWEQAARFFAEAQMRDIGDGCLQVLSRAALPARPEFLLAGIGAEALRDIAARYGSGFKFFGDHAGGEGDARLWATRCAPALAVAMLAEGGAS